MKFTTTNVTIVGSDKVPVESPTQQGYFTPDQLTAFVFANGSISADTGVSLSANATYDIYYRNSLGTLSRLPVGAEGEVLIVSGGVPSWQPALSTFANGEISSSTLIDSTINVATINDGTLISPIINAGGGDVGGDIYYRNVSGQFARLPIGADGNVLTALSGYPQWYTLSSFTSPVLTTPIINVGSDSTGDIYYRNADGLYTRLPIGSTDNVLKVTAGIPAWAASAGNVTLSGTQTFTGVQTFTGIGMTVVPHLSASSIDWVLSAGHLSTVVLSANSTLNNPTAVSPGSYMMRVTQDNIGSRTLSYGSNFKFPSGTAPVLTTTAFGVDILTFVSFGSSQLYLVAQKTFS